MDRARNMHGEDEWCRQGSLKGKRPFGTYRCRWEGNISRSSRQNSQCLLSYLTDLWFCKSYFFNVMLGNVNL
jgi:hypothetical protein